MFKHPLDEQFNIESEDFVPDDFSAVNIPDNPDLDTIINLSLSAYKEQMEVIGLVEPKNRVKYLEVAERFLNQAKDAMAKKEQILIQRSKIKKDPKIIEAEKAESAVGFDRKSLYKLKESNSD